MKTHIPAIGPFLDERREEEAGMTGCDSRSNPCWEPLRAFIQLFTKRGGFKESPFPSSQRRAQPPCRHAEQWQGAVWQSSFMMMWYMINEYRRKCGFDSLLLEIRRHRIKFPCHRSGETLVLCLRGLRNFSTSVFPGEVGRTSSPCD